MIGVDLGGTKVAVAPLRGITLGESLLRPTDRSGTDALIDQLVEMIQTAGQGGIDAVGLGVPSIVEFETGRVVSSVNIPLADVPLRQVLGERLGVPVFVDNDATVAALAEAHDEQMLLVARNLVMLTIGTGVGGGIVLGGRIYRGATGGAASSGTRSSGSTWPGRCRTRGGSRSPARSSPSPQGWRSTGSPPRPPTSTRIPRSAGCTRPASRSSAPRPCRPRATAMQPPPRSSSCGVSGSGSGSRTRSTPSTPTRS